MRTTFLLNSCRIEGELHHHYQTSKFAPQLMPTDYNLYTLCRNHVFLCMRL